MHVLALDVGTSSVKAAVVDHESGQPVGAIARRAYSLDQPEPNAAVIDPAGLWAAVIEAGREASAGRRVEGIGLSVFTPGLILLDEANEPLTPVVTHLDRRARPEARELEDETGAEFLASTGNKPLPGGISGVTFLHLSRRKPGLRSRVRWYLHLNGWLGLRLTGKTGFDPGNASFTGLCAVMEKMEWSPRWCDQFGVDRRWLPPILDGRETLGALLETPAAALSVPAGVPVKMGTADTSCAMLAADVGPDDILHVVGTTQVLAVTTTAPRPSASRLTRHMGVGEHYLHVAHNPVGGVALNWVHQLCFRDIPVDEFFRETVRAAQSRSTDVRLDPPFLGGDRLEMDAAWAGFQRLSLETDRLDLLAAVLAAMRSGHERALATLDLPHPPRRVFLSGGGAKSVQALLPGYTPDRVTVVEEASLRGAARLFD